MLGILITRDILTFFVLCLLTFKDTVCSYKCNQMTNDQTLDLIPGH